MGAFVCRPGPVKEGLWTMGIRTPPLGIGLYEGAMTLMLPPVGKD